MKEKSKSINNPLSTILTNNVHGLIKPIFLTSYYGGSKNGQGVHSLDAPCNTIATKDTFALHHLQYAYGKPTYSDLDIPSQAITTNPKHELVTTKWLYDTQFNRIGNSIHKPCPTIIARQDKKPLYLASASNDNLIDNSEEVPGETEIKMKLRAFMRENGITDIKIRSLQLDELKRIQGFPEDYILEGGKTRSMKYIGNSVAPDMAEALGSSIINGIKEHLKIAV
jgi:DNA (cytosine-5)-methyltransferase 1